jgi:hypothetical protein
LWIQLIRPEQDIEPLTHACMSHFYRFAAAYQIDFHQWCVYQTSCQTSHTGCVHRCVSDSDFVVLSLSSFHPYHYVHSCHCCNLLSSFLKLSDGPYMVPSENKSDRINNLVFHTSIYQIHKSFLNLFQNNHSSLPNEKKLQIPYFKFS